jgi:hypothetical protein
MQKRLSDVLSVLSKNDKATSKICPMSLMTKAVANFTKTVQVRPVSQEISTAIVADSPIMIEMPLLKMIHDLAIDGKHNADTNRFGTGDGYNVHPPIHMNLPAEFMTDIRNTPGMTGHAKWLRAQLESNKKNTWRQSSNSRCALSSGEWSSTISQMLHSAMTCRTSFHSSAYSRSPLQQNISHVRLQVEVSQKSACV